MSEIRRRHFLIASGALLATRFAVGAQAEGRVPLLGYVANRPGPIDLDEAFLSGLREFGYIEGKNIRIEYRWGDGKRHHEHSDRHDQQFRSGTRRRRREPRVTGRKRDGNVDIRPGERIDASGAWKPSCSTEWSAAGS